jgi:hypothetical protein
LRGFIIQAHLAERAWPRPDSRCEAWRQCGSRASGLATQHICPDGVPVRRSREPFGQVALKNQEDHPVLLGIDLCAGNVQIMQGENPGRPWQEPRHFVAEQRQFGAEFGRPNLADEWFHCRPELFFQPQVPGDGAGCTEQICRTS